MYVLTLHLCAFGILAGGSAVSAVSLLEAASTLAAVSRDSLSLLELMRDALEPVSRCCFLPIIIAHVFYICREVIDK